jgi:hypothetical protein
VFILFDKTGKFIKQVANGDSQVVGERAVAKAYSRNSSK